MRGPEYIRERLLVAAQMLRKAGLNSLFGLRVAYWSEANGKHRFHVVEMENTETGAVARLTCVSSLDVPAYSEIVEAAMNRCRVG